MMRLRLGASGVENLCALGTLGRGCQLVLAHPRLQGALRLTLFISLSGSGSESRLSLCMRVE